MRPINPILALCAGTLILVSACNKTDDADSRKPAPPAAPQAQSTAPQSPPSTPTAPMPAPDAPKDATSAGPKPGQANDHSNPDFKAGGKEDRK